MNVHYSEAERVTVEDRGAGFGKLYVHRDDDSIEAILIWTGRGIMTEGVIEPTREQKDRAVRALAETKAGAKVIGYERPVEKPQVERIADAVRQVHDAWVIQGPNQTYHEKAQNALRADWPMLAKALETLEQEMS